MYNEKKFFFHNKRRDLNVVYKFYVVFLMILISYCNISFNIFVKTKAPVRVNSFCKEFLMLIP